MRIKASASFPHPILSPSTGDYGDRVFSIALSVEEEPEIGHAVLVGSMTIDDPSVQTLIESGHAVSGVMISCLGTYLDIFVRIPLGDVRVDLSGGKVRGSVFVRGVVVSVSDKTSLDSEWIDAEFPAFSRRVNAGDIVAMTEELRFEAGLEKLAPLESIFHLKLYEDATEGVFMLDLENESIEILVAPKLHNFLSILRKQEMRDTLLSSLFLPVVMAVLEAMKAEGANDEKRWYSVMSARCNAENINLANCDIAEAAQKLLDAPLGSLQNLFAKESA